MTLLLQQTLPPAAGATIQRQESRKNSKDRKAKRGAEEAAASKMRGRANRKRAEIQVPWLNLRCKWIARVRHRSKSNSCYKAVRPT